MSHNDCVHCLGDSCLLSLQGEEIYHGRDCRTSPRERSSTCESDCIQYSIFSSLFLSCHHILLFFCFLRQEESLIGLLAASQHLLLVLMGVLVPETAPNQGGGPVQKNQRRHDVLAQLQLLVPQQHLSHLHTLPITKASSTAKRPPPLTLKLSKEAQTGIRL